MSYSNSPVNSVQANGVGVILDGQLNAYVQVNPNVGNLRTFTGIANMGVFLQGTSSSGDGGAGLFYWATGTYTDDNGVTTVVPYGNPGGAWLRDPTLVSPNANFTSITTTGTTTIGAQLNADANVAVAGTISTIGGVIATGEISTNGSLYVGTSAGITGGVNVGGALQVTGSISSGAGLQINASGAFGGNIVANGTLFVGSAAFFSSGCVVTGVAEVTELEFSTTLATITVGTGAASGTQPQGSLYLRTGGGVGSTLYVSQGGGTWNAVASV